MPFAFFTPLSAPKLPMISARLANTHWFVRRFEFLLPRCKDFHNQRRNSQKKPLGRYPPPTDNQPPYYSVVCIFELVFSYHLEGYACAVAFWAFHFLFLLFVRVWFPFLWSYFTTGFVVCQHFFEKFFEKSKKENGRQKPSVPFGELNCLFFAKRSCIAEG